MKTKIKPIIAILSMVFSITACQKCPAPITDAEKEAIKKEVNVFIL